MDFVTPEHLESGYAKDYPVIAMPFLTYITGQTAGYLKTYVEEGGILIGTARCGMTGTHGWYNQCVPPFELREVFGVRVLETEAGSDPELTMDGQNYKGYWHKEKLLLSEGTEVTAGFLMTHRQSHGRKIKKERLYMLPPRPMQDTAPGVINCIKSCCEENYMGLPRTSPLLIQISGIKSWTDIF